MRSPRSVWRHHRRQIAKEFRGSDLARADALRKKGRYKASRRVILHALRWLPEDKWLRRQEQRSRYADDEDRALKLFHDGRTEDGIAAMRRLADEFPRDADLHLWLAAMTTTLERFEEAAAHARAALAVEPDDPVVALRAAQAIRWTDAAEALDLLERSERGLASRPPAYDAFRSDTHHLRGLLAHDAGFLDEAVHHLERAFRQEPSGVGHGADLAVAYLEQGRMGDALDVIAAAIEHCPGDDRLLDLRARTKHAADTG